MLKKFKTMTEKQLLMVSIGCVVFFVSIPLVFYLLGERKIGDKLLTGNKTSLQARINETNSSIKSMEKEIAKKPDLEEEKDNLESDITLYEASLPTEQQLEELYEKIEDILRDGSDLTVLSVSKAVAKSKKRGRKKSKELYKKTEYSLSLQGSFFDVLKFINDLENLRRFITVDSLSVNASSDPEDRFNHSVALKMSTYTYVVPSENKSKSKKKKRKK